ncbi:phosphoribosyl 1,2-cyclic phosphate phosphodiesterase [Andreprevotia lacus DSM 23236]|jgi:phosphoribosyl 1,2-cyclic phosphate phosphodiesterase|uniref:Phosphoribosyl 1,2-cyclic phosphate phosphodiesterase n=1 Tax=Andreprevotia lacus DSM 23236 TaxID=1121001 RepID=A0A1W1X6F2_9NEIS|nr:MBL fold metallo-hydrolase [Andreprevotia lacus]SMC19430.1 phosphoribosyl 1,2-cyclic phosphate phosphodiesterase [Andreprevotia lacus DSM 23236]
MSLPVEVTLLGVGSSGGTPALGCPCPTCTSTDPRNRRTRASAVFRAGGQTFLIDTGADLRQQSLREQLLHVDAVLYTHPHADHLHGIDDLRAFCWLQKAPIPVFGNALLSEHISSRFSYTLLSPNNYWDKPVLQLTEIDDEPFEFAGVTVTPIPVLHGKWPIQGFRIGNAAYITDVSEIPEASFARLQGLDLLILDCLREVPHPTHFGVQQALDAATRIAARQTVFIHMTHELEYHALSARMPAGMQVGYDGMRLSAD